MKILSVERIEALRENKGWSKSELARQAGISPSALSHAMRHKNPMTKQLAALAIALEVPIEELLEDEESEPARAAC